MFESITKLIDSFIVELIAGLVVLLLSATPVYILRGKKQSRRTKLLKKVALKFLNVDVTLPDRSETINSNAQVLRAEASSLANHYKISKEMFFEINDAINANLHRLRIEYIKYLLSDILRFSDELNLILADEKVTPTEVRQLIETIGKMESLSEDKRQSYSSELTRIYIDDNKIADSAKLYTSLNPEKRYLMKSLGFAGVILTLAFVSYLYFNKEDGEIESTKVVVKKPVLLVANEIVIDHFRSQQMGNRASSLSANMLEYLILDDLLQSSDYVVRRPDEFCALYNDAGEAPRLRIKGTINHDGRLYRVNLPLVQPNGDVSDSSFTFAHPSALLRGNRSEIANMTTYILRFLDKTSQRKKSTFTQSWDAFVNFYYGEMAWEKLERDVARQKFQAALDIDPSFVLAKLRLADVLRWVNPEAALDTVRAIKPYLGELSRVDSLRARALEARLTGRLSETGIREIDILLEIYNDHPTRKETSYEVAEAYYELCDVEKAIEFYEIALSLDSTFARAHNHLGYCYSHLGDHKQALHHFRTYLSLDSTANAYDSLGDGFMAMGEPDSAARAKEQGILKEPELNYLHGSLSYINIRRGRFTEAERNIENFLKYSDEARNQAVGYFRKALINYFRKDYEATLRDCNEARQLYDSADLVTPNHELHWLLGLVYLELDSLPNAQEYAEDELKQMESLINTYKISATNYRMGIYKFMLHLKTSIAAKTGNADTILDCLKEFDDPEYIKYKIKDHTFPFDLAFFNTAFGELFMEIDSLLNREDLAEERFKKALEYNPNYALAHYNLWKLYEQKEDEENAWQEFDRFQELWKGADPDVKQLYGISPVTQKFH